MFTLSVETVLFTLFGDPFPKGAVTLFRLEKGRIGVIHTKVVNNSALRFIS